VFWGPRAIAISHSGEVYVTDTGNKRVQVFDLTGGFKRMFGGEGTDPGMFKEEVGLTIDAQDNVWVADTWNARIQELSPTGAPIAQIPVSGWESQSVNNKPFLTLDSKGRVIASFPELGRVRIYAPGAAPEEVPLAGAAQPVGLTTSDDGRVLIADARANIVQALPLP
jgi:DNA-binding beta-propeller fold protein YncE